MWGLLICLAVIGVIWLAESVTERKRLRRMPRCPRHFFQVLCVFCELEALKVEKSRDEQNKRSISREYWSIPEVERQRLRLLAEDHIQKSDIPAMAGSIKIAVVNVWRQSKEAHKHSVYEEKSNQV